MMAAARGEQKAVGWIVPAAVLAALIVCGGLLVFGAGRGIDLTDEIFYLVWTRNPDAYRLIYQPFGYLLHPLFVLAGRDLRSYRLVGFVIASGAGALLGGSLATGRRGAGTMAAHGALAALTIFFPWIITPSYNSAANVGAMLMIAGLVQLPSVEPPRRALAVGALAAGLCLAAFAKPPLFAVAIAVMALVGGVARTRRMATALLAATALAAALMALFLSPAHWSGLLARMAASQHVLALPNTPLALPIKIARDWLLVPPSLTGAAIAAGLGLILRRRRWRRALGSIAAALSLWHLANTFPDALDGEIPEFLGLALLTLAAGYAGIRRGAIDRPLATALLLGAPVAVALGTFNNQWAQLDFSMAFPLLALFALARDDPARWRRGLARLVAIAGPVAALLLAAETPYSLPASVFEQRIAVRHPITGGTVLVDPETAAFLAAAHGQASGALLIDLSGTGPGVAAALGARAPVLAWLNPATPSWPDVAWSGMTPDQRDHAWFVGPIWPLFSRSTPARWLVAHRRGYCGQALPEMPFWGRERTLIVWRPCRG